MSQRLRDLLSIYSGSDGEATRALYEELQERFGPVGYLAVALFRAQKTSTKAKGYRRGAHRHESYERKAWSISQAAELLESHGDDLKFQWGWAVDNKAEHYRWVFYVELPTGQVSFHMRARGRGPAYIFPWDGVKSEAAVRICRWIDSLYTGRPVRVIRIHRPDDRPDTTAAVQQCLDL